MVWLSATRARSLPRSVRWEGDGHQPFAWSAPCVKHRCVDFATSKVAEGKLKIALAEGRTVAPGCIVDRAGQPSVEPADFYDGGALLAFGEHKGSGCRC